MKAKSVKVTFIIERQMDLEGDLTIKDCKQMLEQDFWDDARHGNLSPKKTFKVIR